MSLQHQALDVAAPEEECDLGPGGSLQLRTVPCSWGVGPLVPQSDEVSGCCVMASTIAPVVGVWEEGRGKIHGPKEWCSTLTHFYYFPGPCGHVRQALLSGGFPRVSGELPKEPETFAHAPSSSLGLPLAHHHSSPRNLLQSGEI